MSKRHQNVLFMCEEQRFHKHVDKICCYIHTMWCHHNMVNPKCSQNTSHSLPVTARHGLYFEGINCDLYSTSVTVVMYATSCHIGPRYNSTRLCNSNCHNTTNASVNSFHTDIALIITGHNQTYMPYLLYRHTYLPYLLCVLAIGHVPFV